MEEWVLGVTEENDYLNEQQVGGANRPDCQLVWLASEEQAVLATGGLQESG